MTAAGAAVNGLETRASEPLEAALGSLVAELVRREVQGVLKALEAQQRALEAAGEVEWASQAEASRLLGPSPRWFRERQRAGELSTGRHGRVNVAEARALLAKQGPAAEAGASVSDLHGVRVKKAAANLRRAFDRTGGEP